MKRILIGVLAIAMILAVAGAVAGVATPNGGKNSIHVVKTERKHDLQTRGNEPIITRVVFEPEEPQIQEPFTVTVYVENAPEGALYDFSIGLLTNGENTVHSDIDFGKQNGNMFSIIESQSMTDMPDSNQSYYWFVNLYDSNKERLDDAQGYLKVNYKDGAKQSIDYVKEIVAKNKKETDYETALALHDWLVQNAYYDHSYVRHAAGHIFLYGTGVCDSYRKAYSMLLDEAGIENTLVEGRTLNNDEGHAWNAVMLDGKWYQVDATWDDPGEETIASSGSEHHFYFMVPDKHIYSDHNDYNYTLPGDCNSFDRLYYVIHPNAEDGQNGSLIDWISLNQIQNKVETAMSTSGSPFSMEALEDNYYFKKDETQIYSWDWEHDFVYDQCTWYLNYHQGLKSNGEDVHVDLNYDFDTNIISGTYEIIIPKQSIQGASVSINSAALTYTGFPIEPVVSVTLGNTELISDTDYDIIYSGDHINAGEEVLVTVKGKGNYEGMVTTGFTIAERPITENMVTLVPSSTTYTGQTITPPITVTFDDRTLIKDQDYLVEPNSIKDAGDVTINVKGIGNFNGTITKTFTIDPASIEDAEVTVSNSNWIYTGSNINPEVTVSLGNKVLKETDYTISYWRGNVETNDVLNAGTVTIKITGTGNYIGLTKAQPTYTILPKSIVDATVTTAQPSYTYTGNMIEPVIGIELDGKTLKEGVDYSISYSGRHTNVADSPITVTVTGMGNYEGTITGSYTIVPRSIENAIVTLEKNDYIYNGQSFMPEIISVVLDETILSSEDFSASYPTDFSAGEYKVTVIGNSNYSGKATASYTIAPKPITDDDVTITLPQTSYPYTGRTISPTPEVKFGENTLIEGPGDASYDYIVHQNGNCVDVGDCSISIEGHGNYIGTINMPFKIRKASMETDAEITVSPDKLDYTGEALTPAVTVKVSGLTMMEGIDYTLEYANNTNVGRATVTITGKGSCEGSTKESFEIMEVPSFDIADAKITLSDDSIIYNTEEQKPAVTVILNGNTLIPDTDYNVDYANNVHAGKANVTVYGIGKYSGQQTVQFEIGPWPAPLYYHGALDSQNYFKSEEDELYTYYSGDEKNALSDGVGFVYMPRPNPKPEDINYPEWSEYFFKLEEGIDYEVSYENNVNAGEMLVKLQFKGDFCGEDEISITIRPINIHWQESEDDFTQHCEISIPSDWQSYQAEDGLWYSWFPYTGNSIEPDFTLKNVWYTDFYYSVDRQRDEGKAHYQTVPRKDYYVVYENNIEPGKARMTIKPSETGNMIGEMTLEFEILPPPEIEIPDLKKVYYYTGSPIQPQVSDVVSTLRSIVHNTVVERKTLDPTEYTVDYEENQSVGVGTIIITVCEEQANTYRIEFKIAAMPFSNDFSVTVDQKWLMTGQDPDEQLKNISENLRVERWNEEGDETFYLSEDEYRIIRVDIAGENAEPEGFFVVTLEGLGGYEGSMTRLLPLIQPDFPSDLPVKADAAKLPASLLSLGSAALSGTRFSALDLTGSRVASIPENAIAGNAELKVIYLPVTVKSIERIEAEEEQMKAGLWLVFDGTPEVSKTALDTLSYERGVFYAIQEATEVTEAEE